MKKLLIIATFCSTYCFGQINLNTGLVAYYPQNGNLNDNSGNGNNAFATNCNTVTNRYGTPNTSFELTGAGSQWEAPHSLSFATIDNNDEISVSCWIYITGFPQQWFSVLNKYNTPTDAGYTIQLYGPGSTLDFATDNGWFGTNYTFQLNTWYHLVFTYSQLAAQGKFFVNGTQIYSGTHSFALPTTNGPLYVGYNPLGGDEYSAGRVDDLRLYNRVLNAAEIGALYQTPPPTVLPITTCQNSGASLNALGNDIQWYSDAGLTNLLVSGNSFTPSSSNAGFFEFYTVDVIDDQQSAAVPVQFTVNPTYTSTETITICQGESVLIGTQYQNAAGSYPVIYQTVSGCDSIVVTDLYVLPTSASTITQTGCNSLTINSQTFYNSGIYFQTLINSVGCDSVLTLDLTINNSNTGMDVITACDSYTWIDGNTYATNNSTATFILTNMNGCDSIVTLNLTINNSNAGSESVTECDSYTWSANGTTYTTGGTYTVVLTTINGCDSTATLNLTINSVDVTITDNSPVLTANATGSSYQWIDCDDGNTPISGATSQSYTASVNGNYAVEVTQNGCTAISSCYLVDDVGIGSPLSAAALQIYPNPASQFFTISVPVSGVLEMYSLDGKILRIESLSSGTRQFDLVELESGVYVLRFEGEGVASVVRLVVNK